MKSKENEKKINKLIKYRSKVMIFIIIKYNQMNDDNKFISFILKKKNFNLVSYYINK